MYVCAYVGVLYIVLFKNTSIRLPCRLFSNLLQSTTGQTLAFHRCRPSLIVFRTETLTLSAVLYSLILPNRQAAFCKRASCLSYSKLRRQERCSSAQYMTLVRNWDVIGEMSEFTKN